ncbi:MAG: peptidylprolyl isomerase [Nitrospinae bacterium]|nr:peptidylprolyl isomerase [Nitrospinota bacterium]
MASAMAACSGSDSKESGSRENSLPVARVGDRIITTVQLDAEIARYSAILRLDSHEAKEKMDHLRKSLLNHLVDDQALEWEADRQGIDVSGGELDEEVKSLIGEYDDNSLGKILEGNKLTLDEWKDRLKKSMRIMKLIKQEVDDKISLDEAEIKEFFNQNSDDFKWPERARVYQILAQTEPEAVEIRNELLRNADFAKMAKERSQSPDAEKGGDLGYYSRGQLPPEFESAVFGLKEGEISEVIKSTYGYHIFKVAKREKPRAMSYAESRERAMDMIKSLKRGEEFANWLANVKKNAQVTVYPEALAPR